MDQQKKCILSVLSTDVEQWWSIQDILNANPRLHSICLDMIALDSQGHIECQPKNKGHSVPRWHEYRITEKGLDAISKQQETH